MSDDDKGYLAALVVYGILGMLAGSGYAPNEGMAVGRIVGHGMLGYVSGSGMFIILRMISRML